MCERDNKFTAPEKLVVRLFLCSCRVLKEVVIERSTVS